MILHNTEIVNKGQRSLQEFFYLNLDKETDLNIVWDTSEAVMRGFLIKQIPKRGDDKRF